MNTYTNYQLYRTNPKLSGQLKWNLVVNDDVSGLSISDFQLLPISNNALNIKPLRYSILSNTHIENLKSYYSLNHKYFYNDIEYLDMQFRTDESIDTINDKLDLYPTTYNMGCKRALYKRNKKQFEFFCPLWLEKVNSSIEFKFNVHSESKINNTSILLSSKTLKLDISNFTNSEYKDLFNESLHNRFINYINNYLYESGIKSGKNSIGNIEFIESTNFTGSTKFINNCLCLNDIIFKLKSNDTLTKFNNVSLLSETDGDIISFINKTACICPQLINFNLCFNLEDIISNHVVSLLSKNGVFVNVSVDVYVDGILLEKRDFDTEYSFIRKTLVYDNADKHIVSYINKKETYNPNYFNVFKDIKNNKLYESTCHFALNIDNDYIINSFQGFEGVTLDYDINGNVCEYYNDYRYKNTPDIYVEGDPVLGDCSTTWINVKHINKWNDIYKYIQYTDKYKTDGTHISDKKETIINGIKYFNIPKELHNTYILSIVIPEELLSNVLVNFDCICLYTEKNKLDGVYAYQQNDLLIFITTNDRYLTFNRIESMLKNKFNTITNDYWILRYLSKLMAQCVKPLKMVELNDIYSLCFRYDGSIKPRFVTYPCTLHYINAGNKDNGVLKSNEWSYEDVPNIYNSNSQTLKSIINTTNEYSWFNNNKCMLLLPEINFNKIVDNNEFMTVNFESKNMIKYDINGHTVLKNAIIEKFIDIYGLDANDSKFNETIEYLINLYSINTSWDFVDDNPLKYDIKMTLKLR